jgi:hypothetical protein
MSRRLQRALENSVWVFTLALLLLSVWGVGREAYRLRMLVEAQATLGASLAQLEQHALVMERSLLGLAHANHPKVRYVGYDPDALYRMLKQARREVSAHLEAIEALMTPHTAASGAYRAPASAGGVAAGGYRAGGVFGAGATRSSEFDRFARLHF